MYNIIFQTHKIAVSLFLLLYIVKTFLLLTNKSELLAKITKIAKVPEMIISTLFLLTGIYMLMGYPMMGGIFYLKMFCVLTSIPVAIIGFKKSNKYMAAGSLLLIFCAYGLAEINKNSLNRNFKSNPVAVETQDEAIMGKTIYDRGCAACHGPNGDAGIAGAANLKISKLSGAEALEIIKNGKNNMPKFNSLSDTELQSITKYISSLRQ